MRCWVASYLYTAPTPFKVEYIKEADPFLIVDLRKQTGNYRYKAEECITLEIPTGGVLKDTGRAVKDKDVTMKKLCQRIVDTMKRGQCVVIVCYDAMTTSGFIAIICRWWYLYSKGQIPADFDYMKEVRDGNDFTSAKSKEQREQMVSIRDEALRIVRWEGFVAK